MSQELAFAPDGALTAILPCNDLDAAEAFFNRLGFARPDADRPPPGREDGYRLLKNGRGGHIHLTGAIEGWLVPGRNPFGLYLYMENVDALAAAVASDILERPKAPEHKPWGMYEFSLNGPDDTLVRVGWPSRLMREP